MSFLTGSIQHEILTRGAPMPLATLDDQAITDHLARIDADGYTIVEDAIEPELVVLAPRHDPPARARARRRPAGDRGRRARDAADVQPARQGPGVPGDAAPPERAADRRAVLDRGCLLSGMTAIDIGPGEHPQPMHGDDIVMSRHLPRPHAPMMVTSMWALNDFTAENGGTRFVPGSHRFPARPSRRTRSTTSRCARSRCRPGR